MDARATPADLERLLSHTEWLRALARRLVGDAAAADDLVQETWIAAMKSPPDPDRPVRPWLAGVVRRLARMRARTEGRRARRQAIAAKRDELPSTAALVEGVDTQRRLAEVVLELAEPYRTTVLLRYFHELSAAEIARRQSVPAGTVRWRLKRGLDELRERLDRSWDGRRSWCLAFVSLLETGETVASGSGGSGAVAALLGSLWLRLGALAAVGAALLAFGPFAVRPRAVTPIAATSGATDAIPRGLDAPGAGAGTVVRGGAGPTTAEAAASFASSELVVQLREGPGASPAGLRAVLVDSRGAGHLATSDEAGVLRFPSSARGGTLYIERQAAFVHRVELDPTDATAELEVKLPVGHPLVGLLLVDGAAPGEPLTLGLDYDRAIFERDELPAAVLTHLGFCRQTSVDTDPSGRFRFHGLPDDWSGQLWVPEGYVFPGRETRALGAHLHVKGPEVGLVVEVDRLTSDSTRSATELTEPGTSARPTVAIEVRDRAGQPVPDPRARYEGDDSPILGTLDADGALVVPLNEGASRLRVGAAGWRSVVVNPRDGARVVVLERDSLLRLAFVDAQGAPLPGAHVRVHAPGALFAATQTYAPDPLLEHVLPGMGRRARPRGVRGAAGFYADEHGRLELQGIVPGTPLRVQVLDPMLVPLLDRDVAALARDERRDETLVVRAPRYTLRGACTDEEGRALVGAFVTVGVGSDRSKPLRSGLFGVFEIDGLASDTVDIEARKRGFTRRVFEAFPIPDDGTPVRLTLARGHDLAVRVSDADGGLVGGGTLVVRDATGGEWPGVERDLGYFVIEDLPAGSLRARLVLAGRVYEVDHDPVVPELEIRTPVHGRLAVRWNLPDGDSGGRWRVALRPVDELDRSVAVSFGFLAQAVGEDASSGEATFETLVPGQYRVTLERAPVERPHARHAPVGEELVVDVVHGSSATATLAR